MTDVLVSPSVIGDSTSRYPLGNDFVLTLSQEGAESVLRLLRGSSAVWEGRSRKNVLLVKDVRADLVQTLAGLNVVPNLVGAKKLLPAIIAYFLPLYHNITLNKGVSGVGSVGSVSKRGALENIPRYFFDQNTQPEKLQPSIGTIKNQTYYFSAEVPTEIPEFNKKGEYQGSSIKTKPHLITSNKECLAPTDAFQKEKNVIIKYSYPVDRQRWTLTKVGDYVQDPLSPTIIPAELFQRIKDQFKKYVWFSQEEYHDLLPLWVMGTYLFPLFANYPYINLWGLKNTGKSKVMTLSNVLSFNSHMIVNFTPAVMFRIIEQESPTLFIDEAEHFYDKQQSEETKDILAMLNAGWQRGASVRRMEKNKDDEMVPVKFDVYSPKMLGSIKGISGALESRSIRVIMVRANGQSAADLWPSEEDKELLSLRDDLYVFALQHWKELQSLYAGGPGVRVEKEFALKNRDWQVWNPLLCLAKLVGDDVYKRFGEWAVLECERVADDEVAEDTWDYKIQESLLELVTSTSKADYSVRSLKALVDSRFVERVQTDAGGTEHPVYAKSRPSSEFIGRYLNKVGFHRFRKRLKTGVVYCFSRDDVLVNLSRGVLGGVPQEPTLPALPTQPTPNMSIIPESPVEDKVE